MSMLKQIRAGFLNKFICELMHGLNSNMKFVFRSGNKKGTSLVPSIILPNSFLFFLTCQDKLFQCSYHAWSLRLRCFYVKLQASFFYCSHCIASKCSYYCPILPVLW